MGVCGCVGINPAKGCAQSVTGTYADLCRHKHNSPKAWQRSHVKADVWGMGANHSPKKSKRNNAGETKPSLMPKSDPRPVIAGESKMTRRGILGTKR
ncbi:hypothetical protein CUS_7474 [Ruminococcus albus 8]|uniref:Uncharacterized protein n=1 Tax=Ruminococcus albus 8 TaxID=246199 RepID=E9SGU7_RUMAL|nr:hypothetical protein CUS_7474 [Ruminococcus albus 8]